MSSHRQFMNRALQLASNAGSDVKLNPQVGCVIVYDGRIIGEGYHEVYGGNHAEINALNSVSKFDRRFLPEAIVYVTLEPCSHYGKTPPCSHRLVDAGIKNIYIGCKDPNIKISGRGIAYLRSNGVNVTYPFMEKECKNLIHKFKTHIALKRPYVCLKWAQSTDGFIGREDKQIAISGKSSQFYVHKWRAEFQAILVGSGTVITDNPRLDNRLAPGGSPDRIILDRRQRLNGTEQVFRNDDCDVYYCTIHKKNRDLPKHVKQLIIEEMGFLHNSLKMLYANKIASIFIEGGAEIHRSFIQEKLYDEVRIIENKRKLISGIKAPKVLGRVKCKLKIEDDTILFLNQLHLLHK